MYSGFYFKGGFSTAFGVTSFVPATRISLQLHLTLETQMYLINAAYQAKRLKMLAKHLFIYMKDFRILHS